MELILLISVCAIAWFWFASMNARDLAVAAGRNAAEQYGLQFLDDTVAISKLWAARDKQGHMRLQRTYHFEVSDTGAERLSCSVTVLGGRVSRIDMPPYRDNVVRIY